VGLFLEAMATRHHPSSAPDGQKRETILAVCHGGIFEVALNHIFNVGPNQPCGADTHNTAITCLQHVSHSGPQRWRLRYHNRVTHLAGVEEGIFV
jgi:broad specificity phosphatase PhoE